MTRLHLSLAAALLGTSAMFAAEGMGGGSPGAAGPDTKRVAYIVHKTGEAATLELSPSGRVLTEPFDRPEWAGSVAAAALYERNNFYQTRLGADRAEPLLNSNIINFDDLEWVALSNEDETMGQELTIPASAEHRNEVLIRALDIKMEETDGDVEAVIANSITDHYIDNDGKGYTLAELASKQEADAVFGKAEKSAATGG